MENKTLEQIKRDSLLDVKYQEAMSLLRQCDPKLREDKGLSDQINQCSMLYNKVGEEIDKLILSLKGKALSLQSAVDSLVESNKSSGPKIG